MTLYKENGFTLRYFVIIRYRGAVIRYTEGVSKRYTEGASIRYRAYKSKSRVFGWPFLTLSTVRKVKIDCTLDRTLLQKTLFDIFQKF